MKFALLALCVFVVGPAVAETQCTNENGTSVDTLNTYLNCLSNAFVNDSINLDHEIHTNEISRATKCFAPSVLSAKTAKKCYLSPIAINTPGYAWSLTGPMQGCFICQHYARTIVNAIVGMNPVTAKCVSEQIWPAISNEANYCVRENGIPLDGDIKMPLFAFKGGYQNVQHVLHTASVAIMEELRIHECEKRNPKYANNTNECLEQADQKLLEKHCAIRNQCNDAIGFGCMGQIEPLENAVCDCLDRTINTATTKIESVVNVIEQIYANRSLATKKGVPTRPEINQCVASIKEQLKTNVTDWYETVNTSIKKCVLPGTELDVYLSFFCNNLIQNIASNGPQYIRSAFTFTQALLNSASQRGARFCNAKGLCNTN